MVTCVKYFKADGLTVKQHDFHSVREFLGDDVTGQTGSIEIPFIYIEARLINYEVNINQNILAGLTQ